MQPITISVGPLAAASANNIATTQIVSGAANVLLNGSTVTGGVAVLDKPRRVLITSAGNDSGITFTVYGTWLNGQVISETVQGANVGTVATTLDFSTVTRIATSASTSASGITAGTNGVAGSSWCRFDDFAPGIWSIQVNASGTVNYTVQITLDDPFAPINPTPLASVNWLSTSDSALASQTATKFSSFTGAPCYVRVLLNSGTGSATARILQSSNGPI